MVLLERGHHGVAVHSPVRVKATKQGQGHVIHQHQPMGEYDAGMMIS